MSEIPTFSAAESIRATLETYDPNNTAVLIGSSAIHWTLASRGLDTSTIRFNDVDVMVSDENLDALQAGLNPDSYQEAKRKNNRLTVTPSASAEASGVVVFDALSDAESYDDPMIYIPKGRKRIYATLDNLSRFTEQHDGIKHISLPFVFWWKTTVGRDSDLKIVQQTLRVLYEQSGFRNNELYDMRRMIDYANDGLLYNRDEIYVDY